MVSHRNRFTDYGSHLALVNLSFDHVRCSVCDMRALRIHEPCTHTSTSRQHKQWNGRCCHLVHPVNGSCQQQRTLMHRDEPISILV
jgi:hypothetical protein